MGQETKLVELEPRSYTLVRLGNIV
jgi:hypothetical protein